MRTLRLFARTVPRKRLLLPALIAVHARAKKKLFTPAYALARIKMRPRKSSGFSARLCRFRASHDIFGPCRRRVSCPRNKKKGAKLRPFRENKIYEKKLIT